MKQHNYFVYILTDRSRNVLYTGVTNNLSERVIEHYLHRGNPKTFTGRYHCYCLIFFEWYHYIVHAIAREKQVKGWTRKKKIDLINTFNPEWKFLNEDVCEEWPPKRRFRYR
jgi:putative endonuclease